MVLPELAIDVFIGAALARPIGSCEVCLAAQSLRNPFVIGEFAAVVEGDRMDGPGYIAHGVDDGVSDADFRAVRDRSTDQRARFALHDGDQSTFMKCVC